LPPDYPITQLLKGEVISEQSLSPRLNWRLTQNTLIKLLSEGVGRLASLVLVILAARQLGEVGFGLYSYGLALGFVLAQGADMGLQILTSREVALHGAQARPTAQMALQLKLALSLVVLAVLLWVAVRQPASARLSLLLLGLAQLSYTYLEFMAYIYRGQQALSQEAWLLGAARVGTAVCGILILWQGGNVNNLAAVSLLVMVVMTAVGLHQLRRTGWLHDLAKPIHNATYTYTALLHHAFPLGIAIFLSIAYTRLAVLLLHYRLGETAVAQYSAAARLVEPMLIIPASLLAAVFPVITLAWQQDRRQARLLGLRVSGLLAGCGFLLAIGFWLTAVWLIPTLYGPAYLPAVPVLQLLALALIPAFINYSLTHYLIARKQQAYIAPFSGGMFLLHALLSWRLITAYGIVGPAISTIIAESLLLVACILTLRFREIRN
jgi:O-antigen/teichoic acid export membrane protein